ncbi:MULTISPECIES: winged helix-turn-helix domain-containing protein [unclassified Lentimonas]|uniref:winged helix-turn-helix domain-containing protein n=1 Tax=unclassified Lentimonas TaxID=2630993 RepID=UPI0013284EEA|nr:MULTISPECIES: crosslink repair DNA glycosylase YcaQ family protein [unclassified Lentimonas]CAA6692296.1 FIG074102: hypothetical protein [Lentimonas sp. CC19]CAA6696395.1 FIG074102: hypothetical protein [Lentimonas sp. CC10]CAA7069098.1 FIG074102: hypothetical protein [Lentimonas sp. CC11]
MPEPLSIQQAQKLVLHAQRVLATNQAGRAIGATLSAIEHLGYIQIDTISVIQRAHHHTLWNRNARYQASQLDQLLAGKHVFEYWSHAAAYLPFRDYRFSLPRKHAFKSGKQSHWYDRDETMIQWVLDRITAEGPLMARDFEQTVQNIGGWKAKPAKRALEYLFMQGDLMVPRRDNFHKVYDLTERVLPESTDTRLPSPEEYARFLITSYLRSNGLGQAAEIAYLLKGIKAQIASTLKEMQANGELRQLRVCDTLYYALPDSLDLLGKPLPRSKLKILSPFDNLVIQRKRMKALFDFDYQIECYLPASKREYGYFSLPILWNGKLVARMDCKAERTASVLHIHHLALEATALKNDAFLPALSKELECFLKFNQCNTLQLHRTSPVNIKQELDTLISHWTVD